ncbi:hypothetical protein XENOCAPTIV_001490, partial [Xenoophorus captivus]
LPPNHRRSLLSSARCRISSPGAVFPVCPTQGGVMEKMSRRHPLPLNPAFLAPNPHGVLKSLLENPMKLPLHHEGEAGGNSSFIPRIMFSVFLLPSSNIPGSEECRLSCSKEQEKEKNLEEECSAPQSAFLGPTLWDKTLSYDGDTFQLEYMDLEEFLSENGIPASPSQHQQDQHQAHHALPRPQPIMTTVPPTPARSVMDLSSHASTSVVSPNCLHSSPAADKNLLLLGAGVGHMYLRSLHVCTLMFPPFRRLPNSRNTPSPIDPESIQVPVSYEPDPADLALSSVPGQEIFDPRKRKFSAEELKPQPMIKKARKVFIPEDLKENQIAIRASFLEKENSALRQEVADLRKELGRAKNILVKYEAQHGLL